MCVPRLQRPLPSCLTLAPTPVPQGTYGLTQFRELWGQEHDAKCLLAWGEGGTVVCSFRCGRLVGCVCLGRWNAARAAATPPCSPLLGRCQRLHSLRCVLPCVAQGHLLDAQRPQQPEGGCRAGRVCVL